MTGSAIPAGPARFLEVCFHRGGHAVMDNGSDVELVYSRPIGVAAKLRRFILVGTLPLRSRVQGDGAREILPLFGPPGSGKPPGVPPNNRQRRVYRLPELIPA